MPAVGYRCEESKVAMGTIVGLAYILTCTSLPNLRHHCAGIEFRTFCTDHYRDSTVSEHHRIAPELLGRTPFLQTMSAEVSSPSGVHVQPGGAWPTGGQGATLPKLRGNKNRTAKELPKTAIASCLLWPACLVLVGY